MPKRSRLKRNNKRLFKIGEVVHIDVDNDEWGRVASDATIVAFVRGGALVNAHNIRANVIVPFEELMKR